MHRAPWCLCLLQTLALCSAFLQPLSVSLSPLRSSSRSSVTHFPPHRAGLRGLQLMQKRQSFKPLQAIQQTEEVAPAEALDSRREEAALDVKGVADALLAVIGLSTRWAVAGSVAAALLIRRDPETLTWVVGGISSGVLSKVLKKLFNQCRPEGSRLVDPGMPSSHAVALFFLSSYVGLSLQTSTPGWWPLDTLQTQGALASYAIVASLWRVKVGFHSLPQVLVGAGVGSLFALLWFSLCHAGGVNAALEAVLGPSISLPLSILVVLVGSVGVGGFLPALEELVKTGTLQHTDKYAVEWKETLGAVKGGIGRGKDS